ncbi:MAG: L-fucose isomerase [Clostridia bacterium]|nr:L-fucose isomerase [Clostridia bacterium]
MKNLIGSYPKIGIRPIIDGRRKGIRESLEDKTAGLAKAVADLLSANLRYPDGSPVQCVIADKTIGGVAEAALCESKFEKENVGLTISVTPCWCYGTETLDMHPTRPKAIFGFNGTERPGAVYLAAALAAHNHRGLPAFSIYGHEVQDLADNTIPEDAAEKLLAFARAGLAVAIMKGKSYLAMGTVSMGIAGSIVNDNFLYDYLGMRTEYIDLCEFDRRMEQGIYDKAEYKKALAWVKENCPEGEDRNVPEKQHTRKQKDKEWETCVKMTLIARDLMEGNPKLARMGYIEESNGHNAIAAGFQGQRQWTDFRPNGDFLEAMLNSSFDWNGVRAPYIVATENDSYNGISQLFGYLLTNAPAIFADVRTYWSPESVKRVTGYDLEGDAAGGIIHLINSGAAALDGTGEMEVNGKPGMKPFWEISAEEADKCLKATKWSPAATDYFRGGGFSSSLTTRGGMPVTMVRINNVKGLGPVLQIAEGVSCDLPEDVHTALMDRTDPTWPCTWFAPRLTGEGAFKDVYSVMANWGANHGAFCYGHVGADFITLASMLRIPVSMHNVPDEKIYRPTAWGAFGTKDLEGADYRACATYGPLYNGIK